MYQRKFWQENCDVYLLKNIVKHRDTESFILLPYMEVNNRKKVLEYVLLEQFLSIGLYKKTKIKIRIDTNE